MSASPSPLDSILEDLGARFGTREGVWVVTHCEGVASEARAARTSAGLADLSFMGLMALRGPDRLRFLHGQCTQDVQGLQPGEGGYGFFLEAKGQNLGDARFLALQDELRLSIHPERMDALQARMDRYALLSEVKCHILSGRIGCLLLTGPAARATLQACGARVLPRSEGSWIEVALGHVPTMVEADAETGGDGGFRIWGQREHLPALFGALHDAGQARGLRLIGYDAVDVLRTEAGRPWFGRDLDESVLPEESGQLHRAVSLDKGCYLGQEVVARQHFRGSPRKSLCGLLPDGGVREGDAVWEGDRELGVLTTVLPSPTLDRLIALAVLKGASHEVGTRYTVRGPSGEVPLRVAALPFVPMRGAGDSDPEG